VSTLLTTAEVAQRLRASENFVRAHAAELGGVRLGGRRQPLRFEEAGIRAYIERQRLKTPEPPAPRTRNGPRRRATEFDVLPVPTD
jgi:hypothetical protein